MEDPRDGKSTRFNLPGSDAVYRAIWSCWQSNVLLEELAHRFWRLTLLVGRIFGTQLSLLIVSQLIGRYKLWVEESIAPLIHPGLLAAESEKVCFLIRCRIRLK